MNRPHPAPRRSPSSVPVGPSKGRVLCVDDEPGILRSLQWLLQDTFELTLQTSARAALPLLAQGEFDVVISDQRMPGMTGVEFLEQVRRLSPRSMRILLTGYSDMAATLRSVNDSEIFRFVAKPWDEEELPRLVEQAARIARVPEPAPASRDEPVQDASIDSVLVIDEDDSVARRIKEVLGPEQRVVHASSLADAVAAIQGGRVGIVVAATQLCGTDTTRLVRMLKQDYPAIVSMIYTDVADGVDVVTLINQGQIFRFLPKPIRPATLRLALAAATAKRKELRQRPALRARHAVQALPEADRQAFLAQLAQVAHWTQLGRAAPPGPVGLAVAAGQAGLAGLAAHIVEEGDPAPAGSPRSPLLRRIGGSLRRLIRNV